MSRPDEGLIHAWLDGELEPVEAERVKRLSETEPEWAAAVAEARGLIAASSRIVRALDAVPGRVIPSRTARTPMAARPFRVRPWMGMAAGLVLVVGTAYVMRESTQAAFGPGPDANTPAVAEVSAPTAAPAPPAAASTATVSAPAAPAQRMSAPATVPAVVGERREATITPSEQSAGPLRQLADDAGRDASGAGSTGTLGAVTNQPAPVAIAPAPSVSPAPRAAAPTRAPARTLTPSAPPPAPVAAEGKAAAEEDRALARARTSSDRLSQVVVTSVAELETPAATLAGCWRASAPDSLAALYRDLTIMRAAGDTLELLLPNTRTVLVVRDGDALRGALTAVREVCPPRP